MKTNTTLKSLLGTPILIAIIAFTTITAITANSTELVRNGNFDQVLVDWGVDDALGSWIPYEHPGGTVNLHPSSPNGYVGTIISQPLNVNGIANQTVDISIDLGCDWNPPEGNSIALYLEYIDNGGVRQRAKVINPDNLTIPVGSLDTYTASYTFPPEAVLLAGIAIDKLYSGSIRADNISLASSTLSTGPIPHLKSITPTAIAYGNTVEIKGNSFGSSQGRVFIGQSTNGVTVQSWTSNLIVALVTNACTGGNIQVDALGPRTCEKRNLDITSPHFLVDVSLDNNIALAGQQLQIGVRANFAGGFTTTTGVQFKVTEAPLAGTFLPNPVMRDGGSLLTFDTTGLTNGMHTFTVCGIETNSPDRTKEFTLDIRSVGNLECTIGTNSLDGYAFSNQTPVTATTTLTDTLGNDITYNIPKATWTSSSPTIIDVFQEYTPWGSLYLLPHTTGSATIQATLPNGSNYNFAVTVTVPADPYVIAHYCTSATMSNDPTETNELFFHASGPMSYYSYSISDLGVNTGNSYWNGDNSSHTYEFTLYANEKPGTYMFHSSGTVSGENISDGCLLHVVNNPTTGMIKGHLSLFDIDRPGAGGFLYFYDTNGVLQFTRDIWEWTFNYTLPSIPPGNYKLCYELDAELSQWFPNATNYITADTVTIVAGSTLENVNFTFSSSDEPIPPPPISSSLCHTGTVFSFSVQTTNGLNYDFQKSANLKDGSWFTLEQIWGDNTSKLLEDTNAVDSMSFYRVLSK